MGRVKPKGSKTKEQDGPSRFDAWADISQSFQQPRWKMYELEFEKGRDEKVQVFGHYIVATGDEIWCIGGFRPCERAKISLLKLKLHSKCWDDLTPPDNAIAPAWRWGHSACVIGKQVVQKQVISSILLCGGFNKNCNHDDVWHFCPKEKVFTEPQASLQRLPFHGAYHSLAYDSFSEEAYIFGGQCCVGGPYVYSDRVLIAQMRRHRRGWQELRTSGVKPPARAQHAAVIVESGTMIIYGGANSSSTLHDVWTLDLRKAPPQWSEVRTSSQAPFVSRFFTPRDFEVVSSRPQMASHGSGVIVVGEGRGHCLSLWALQLGRWHSLPAAGAPTWAGNFAATFLGDTCSTTQNRGTRLLVFGGENCRGQCGGLPGGALHHGGLWTLDLILKPSNVLQRTLRCL
ncbi:unnamed protein product [Durusdinium trenchii]|uniref:Uncharacterized protein n=1 Tax=Durusdinium trenchii TaxID=1381693 RepID=A0ABP0IDU7_9DINO